MISVNGKRVKVWAKIDLTFHFKQHYLMVEILFETYGSTLDLQLTKNAENILVEMHFTVAPWVYKPRGQP